MKEMVDLIGILIKVIETSYPKIKERFISKENREQNHLEEIKKEVLDPLVKNLSELYIPVLKHEKLAIEYSRKYLPKKGMKATEYPLELETKLVLPPPEYNLDSTLYKDAEENHYAELFDDFEAFRTDFDAYARAWLSYASEIQKAITKDVDLPPYRELTTPFVDAPFLAQYVVGRLAGLNLEKLWVPKEGEPRISIGSRQVLVGNTENEVKKCEETVNKFLESNMRIENIKQPAKKLLKRAEKIKSTVDKLRRTQKLSGNCEYI